MNPIEEVEQMKKNNGILDIYKKAFHELAVNNLDHDDYLIFKEVEKQSETEFTRLRGILDLLMEVDRRVPGLQWSYQDEHGIPLGVRISQVTRGAGGIT